MMVFKKGHKTWNKGTKGLIKPNSGSFKKGHISWNKDKPRSEETKRKMSETRNKRFAEGKITSWNKGTKGLIKSWNKGWRGYTNSGSFKKGHSGITGKDNHFWRGGVSFEPYGPEFNNALREQIRKRDNYRCQQCFRAQDELRTKNNRPYKLHVHHIDFQKTNNYPNNLISLCKKCHAQTGFNRSDWTEYFKNQLGGRF